jgi:arabinofuranosyltransferase
LAAGIAALGAIVVWQLALVGDFRVDDAYITFSFSKNLAEGNGPIFSNGERVEGYSNFLWMALNALTRLLFPAADPYVPARVLTFTALFLLAIGSYRLARRHGGRASSWLALFFLAMCTDLTRAAMSGLETIPEAAAIVWGWHWYLDGSPAARRRARFAWLAVLLLRIDGFVPFLTLLGFDVLLQLAERRASLRELARWAAPIVLAYAVYFGWRYAYYGLPLPTTYYAKSMVGVEVPQLGNDLLWFFFRDYGLLAILPFMLFPLVRGPRREAVALGIAIASQLAYFAMIGGDWMPFERFFLAIVPLGAILASWGFELTFYELRRLPNLLRWPARVALLGPIAFSTTHMHDFSIDTREEQEKVTFAKRITEHTHRNLLGSLDLLRFVLRKPGDRLVTDYAGVFALFTDATVIDMWGLCNADIALHGSIENIHAIYGKQCPECIRRADPDYFHVIMPLVRSPRAFADEEAVIGAVFLGIELDRVLRFRDDYAVGRVIERRTSRAFWFLERRRAGRSLARRSPAKGIFVDYPFETPSG